MGGGGGLGGIVRSGLDFFSGGNTGKIADAVGVNLDSAGLGQGAVKISNPFAPKSADTSSLDAAQATMQQRALAASNDLEQIRAGKNQFAQQLLEQAQGKAPSLAEAQLRSAQDRTLAQQLAAARSNRNVSPGLASRNLINAQGQQGAQLAQQAAQARLAEQQQNQNAFQNYLGGQQAYEQGLLTGQANLSGQQAQASAQRAAADNAFTGNLIGTAASILPMVASDKNLKKDIKPISTEKSSKSFLDALQAYTYQYKDAKNGKGQQIGVMAQDLEKAGPVGKAMVQETPQGKAVDYAKGFGAMLAAQADLNKRLSKIEKKKA